MVACGFGDDAEELRRRGYDVRAFDVAPTAIERCRKRFPDSTVDYRVADLFALPADWAHGHLLVVEIQTIQSLPLARRAAAIAAVAAMVAPGGELFVRAAARRDDEPVHGRPWPVSRAELGAFTAHGLVERSFVEERDEHGSRWFHIGYVRPRGQHVVEALLGRGEVAMSTDEIMGLTRAGEATPGFPARAAP